MVGGALRQGKRTQSVEAAIIGPVCFAFDVAKVMFLGPAECTLDRKPTWVKSSLLARPQVFDVAMTNICKLSTRKYAED